MTIIPVLEQQRVHKYAHNKDDTSAELKPSNRC